MPLPFLAAAAVGTAARMAGAAAVRHIAAQGLRMGARQYVRNRCKKAVYKWVHMHYNI